MLIKWVKYQKYSKIQEKQLTPIRSEALIESSS